MFGGMKECVDSRVGGGLVGLKGSRTFVAGYIDCASALTTAWMCFSLGHLAGQTHER